MSLPSYAKVGSSFLSARNDHDVKVANRNEIDVSINADVIFRNNFIARSKPSFPHKIQDTVRSETLDEMTRRAMPKRSNSSIGKKVRFSDRIELFENTTHNHLNSESISNKKDKVVIDPYDLKELLEFFEDNRALMNEKKPKITTDGSQKTKRTYIKEKRKIEDSDKCIKKKITEDGKISNGDKISHAKKLRIKDCRRNSKKEKNKVNIKTRKTHHLKKKKSLNHSDIDKESLDRKINVSVPLNMIRNFKLSLDTKNKAISSKLDEKEEHSRNEEILQRNILNEGDGAQKNGTITIKDFKNKKKSEKERKLDDESNLIKSRTKVQAIDNKEEFKQKEEETISNVLESLEDTILYPSTSTPFDSPQIATNGLSLNFQRLSPIHEHQSAVVVNTFNYFEPSVVYTGKTYSKRKLKNISKSEKLWSLISTTTSFDSRLETISTTAIFEGSLEPEENSEDIPLFETPPVKMVSGGSIDRKRQHKEAENNKKNHRFHKETKYKASRGTKRKSNKITTDKRENNSDLSIRQSHLSQHFEDVSEWNLCIEKKENKTKFFAKGKK
ncbi:hypothetical protein HNY73_019906 [Argiope bruennichi]|uniref:Uncharacterized protein n=1 Tax=Argiope bruennichi TaxID=94029 RepID=A0A8T0E9G2_ARGBR|nr:hypothetical protein HNY73_019906 [Argiope bruennichi]